MITLPGYNMLFPSCSFTCSGMTENFSMPHGSLENLRKNTISANVQSVFKWSQQSRESRKSGTHKILQYTPFCYVKSSLICERICHHFIYILFHKEICISGKVCKAIFMKYELNIILVFLSYTCIEYHTNIIIRAFKCRDLDVVRCSELLKNFGRPQKKY